MIYRLKIKPHSPWTTPWEADTLSGLLCATMAREIGADALRDEIIAPALAGKPPFVLSDALPGDLLPVPIALRLLPCDAAMRKRMKRARYITPETWANLQTSGTDTAPTLLPEGAIGRTTRQRNTVARDTDTTRENGLFDTDTFHLAPHTEYLSVYFWSEPAFLPRFMELFARLTWRGYGGDTSVGSGQFAIAHNPEPNPFVGVAGANAVVSLSTFQPAPCDPTDGYWETLTKRGRIGPDFGLPNDQTAKNPLLLLRPGACFFTDVAVPWGGRAIPMRELLCPAAYDHLHAQGVEIIQYAFGLFLPCALPKQTKES